MTYSVFRFSTSVLSKMQHEAVSMGACWGEREGLSIFSLQMQLQAVEASNIYKLLH